MNQIWLKRSQHQCSEQPHITPTGSPLLWDDVKYALHSRTRSWVDYMLNFGVIQMVSCTFEIQSRAVVRLWTAVDFLHQAYKVILSEFMIMIWSSLELTTEVGLWMSTVLLSFVLRQTITLTYQSDLSNMVSLCFKNSSRSTCRKSKMVPQSLPRLSQVRKKESWVNAVFACWKSGYLKLFLSHHARICSISNVFDPCSNSIIQVFRVLCAARSLIWNKMLKTIQMKSVQVRKGYL